MNPLPRHESAIVSDRRGMATIEWVLLIAVILLPGIVIVYEVMSELVRFYSFSSWSISLPFP